MNDLYFEVGTNLMKLPPLSVYFGGRGVGKTFNILKHLIDEDLRFIWLRDTETVVDKMIAGNSITFPLELEYPDFPHIECFRDNKIGKFATFTPDKEIDKTYGYLMALSTFKNARGLDFSDIQVIVFDEFIPELGAKQTISYMGETFLNMYETVNRNRELKGQPPVHIILLSNTNEIYSPVIEALGLSDLIEDMSARGKKLYKTADIHVEFIDNKKFTEAKENTFLYRVASSNRFREMALNNAFSESRALIRRNMKLQGYKPVLQLVTKSSGEYVLLTNDEKYYWKKGHYKELLTYDMDNKQEAMLLRYLFTDNLRQFYISGNMYFDSIFTQRNILDLVYIK